MLLADAVKWFLDEKRGWPTEGPPADTVRTYGSHLGWLVAFAQDQGRPCLADLTDDLLREAMAAKMAAAARRLRTGEPRHWKDGRSAANGVAYAARKLVSWLVAQGVPVTSTLRTVKPPRPPERVQPRLRGHEFQALETAVLRRWVDPSKRAPNITIARDLALINLLADTGLRAFEVCRMTLDSVDFELGSVTVFGKGHKERSLSLIDASDPRNTTLRLLSDWIDTRRQIHGGLMHEYLWVSIRGKPMTRDYLRATLNGICREAGLSENRPPHTFRRGAFTEGYRDPATPMRVLVDRMGWSKKSHHMEEVYTRGAELDMARNTPVPSVSGRWRQPVTQAGPRSFDGNGVGPPDQVRRNGRAAPTLGRRDATQTALSNPLRAGRRSPS